MSRGLHNWKLSYVSHCNYPQATISTFPHPAIPVLLSTHSLPYNTVLMPPFWYYHLDASVKTPKTIFYSLTFFQESWKKESDKWWEKIKNNIHLYAAPLMLSYWQDDAVSTMPSQWCRLPKTIFYSLTFFQESWKK